GADNRKNRLVGFVDDDPRKAGTRVMGYPVLGGYSALTVLINSSSVESIVISARTMPPERLNNLTTLCAERGVRLSRLHVGLESLVEGDEPVREKPSRAATIHQIKKQLITFLKTLLRFDAPPVLVAILPIVAVWWCTRPSSGGPRRLLVAFLGTLY